MMDKDRFIELMERYLAGTLDEASGAELREAIESSAELREHLRVQLCMDTLLARRFRQHNVFVGRRVRAALRDPTQKKGAITRIMEKLPDKVSKKNAPRLQANGPVVSKVDRRQWFVHSVVAAAALVALAIGLFIWSRSTGGGDPEERAWALPLNTQTVATAVPESGAVSVTRNGRTLELKKARPLISGDVLATEKAASVVLNYPDKTRVMIPSETKLELQPPKLYGEEGISISLSRGAMDADVTPQTRPMVIATPLGRAEILGTKFTLMASPAESRLEVHEGKVKLTSSASPDSVVVNKNEMAILSPNSKLEATPLNRDPALWPFSAKSAWNYPMGSGAKFAPVDSPRFDPDKGVTLAVDADAIPIYIGIPNDPQRIVFRTTQDKSVKLRVPQFAKPEPSVNKYLNFIDEMHYKVYEMRGVQFLDDGSIKLSDLMAFNSIQENAGVYANDKPHGMRAYGGSSLGGIIRKGELASGIRHAIGMGVVVSAINQNTPTGKAYVWPASTAAVLWEQIYGKTGNLHLGSLLAIPPNVDIKKIGVGTSGPAYEIARAMQDYGVYIIDHEDDAPKDMKLFFEPTAKDELPKGLDGQVAKLMRFLQVVANNSADNIGGGGKPRRAFAPPFAKEWIVKPENLVEKPKVQ